MPRCPNLAARLCGYVAAQEADGARGGIIKVTQEHVDARRRQILSAALRAFARNGFHRTTMQDIIREAEFSPGAVYSYFAGKDELIAAIIAEMMGFVGQTAALFSEPLPVGRLRRNPGRHSSR